MPAPDDSDYLDDDFGELDETQLPEPAQQTTGGEDALPHKADEEPHMTSPITPTEDRSRIKGGERGDDDRAPEAISEHGERKARQEDLLDEGIEETFPASDPVSVKHIT